MSLIQKLSSKYLSFCNSLWKLNVIAASRTKSTNAMPDQTAERVVLTDDGSVIVCWHPERPFPYEFSKPLPEEKSADTNSVLKVQNMAEVYDVFKPKTEEQTRSDLMKLTFTTKHRWFPPGKKHYKMKRYPKLREYL